MIKKNKCVMLCLCCMLFGMSACAKSEDNCPLPEQRMEEVSQRKDNVLKQQKDNANLQNAAGQLEGQISDVLEPEHQKESGQQNGKEQTEPLKQDSESEDKQNEGTTKEQSENVSAKYATTLPDMNQSKLKTLSEEAFSWGQGVNLDENDRPISAVEAQKTYGKYGADFVKTEEEKTIYLTFDEGYENGYSSVILDTLKEKDCKAVFFITMDYAKREPELIMRMIKEGHVVGAHSVSHPANGMPSLSLEEQQQEIVGLHEYVQEQFDYNMYLFRFPAGIYSEQSLALVQQLGYQSVFWSYAYADWDPDNQMAVEEALNKAMSRLHGGAIYLLHAVSSTNSDMLGDFIDKTREKGFTFELYE